MALSGGKIDKQTNKQKMEVFQLSVKVLFSHCASISLQFLRSNIGSQAFLRWEVIRVRIAVEKHYFQ